MSLQNSKQISDVKVLLKMGSDGSGIASIEKTGTSGIVDTYTITYDNGNKTTFTVTNGNGIVSIAKTGTSGLVDTYTITFQDQTTTTFEVTNGRGISSIEKTATQGLVDTYTITYNDNTTSTFTVTNGEGSTASTLPYNNATSGLSATNVQDAIDEVDGNVDTLQDTKANQTVIATRQTNLVAVKKYEIGEQFIYNNTLYKADAVINQNGTITIGGNASLADDISTQISNLPNLSSKFLIESKTTAMAFSNIRYSTKDVNIAKSGYKALGLVGSGCGDAVNNILTAATFNGTNIVSFVMLRADRAAYTGNVNVNYQILYVEQQS